MSTTVESLTNFPPSLSTVDSEQLDKIITQAQKCTIYNEYQEENAKEEEDRRRELKKEKKREIEKRMEKRHERKFVMGELPETQTHSLLSTSLSDLSESYSIPPNIEDEIAKDEARDDARELRNQLNSTGLTRPSRSRFDELAERFERQLALVNFNFANEENAFESSENAAESAENPQHTEESTHLLHPHRPLDTADSASFTSTGSTRNNSNRIKGQRQQNSLRRGYNFSMSSKMDNSRDEVDSVTHSNIFDNDSSGSTE